MTKFESIIVTICLCACAVSAVFEDGGVSGDFFEHWNKNPDPGPRALSGDIVQALHFSLLSTGKVRVTWMNPRVFVPGNSSFVPSCMYGDNPDNMIFSNIGVSYTYTAGDFDYTLSSVVLDLSSLSGIYVKTYYKCGYPSLGWSSVYSLQLQPPTVVNENHDKAETHNNNNADDKTNIYASEDDAAVLALIADLGVIDGDDTMLALEEFVSSGLVKVVVHAGDISYADNYSKDKLNNSYIWVEYMNKISTFTPSVPYMTCPGNHEAQFNFAAYLNWLPPDFNVDTSGSPFWGSFDYMGVHFVSMSTEHDFSQLSEQYQFIQDDLMQANQNRANVPWIVVFGHRPLYCSCSAEDVRCKEEAPRYRSYIEDLFYQQKVDVYVCGHNHNYERTYPMYKEKAAQKNFTNPAAPVYIVNGEAGNPEPNLPSFYPNVDWRANFSGSADNGFLLMKPTQNSLQFQFIHSKDRLVMDSFTMTKT